VIGHHYGELGHFTGYEQVCHGCDQSQCTHLRRNEVSFDDVRRGEMNDIDSPLFVESSCL